MLLAFCFFSFCVVTMFCSVVIAFLDVYSHICIKMIDDNINNPIIIRCWEMSLRNISFALDNCDEEE